MRRQEGFAARADRAPQTAAIGLRYDDRLIECLADPREAATYLEAARKMSDPMSRLVVAGVLLRLARASPETIGAAVETASNGELSRPLLARPCVQARLAEYAKDGAFAGQIRRRIELSLEPTER